MRSIITLVVEHGETTDPFGEFLINISEMPVPKGASLIDYAVRVDVPPCFSVDSPHKPECRALYTRTATETPLSCNCKDN